MRRRSLMTGGLMAGGSAMLTGGAHGAPATVVLELFTSQGCSSCPPADALLGELTRQPRVIALAWHVDYWNNQAWRDPYASQQWTDRQRFYAQALSAEVFTPALVVDGTVMVVGSDRTAVSNAISRAPELPLAVSMRRGAKGLSIGIDSVDQAASILLAVYDLTQATSVAGGENAGRRLHDYHVVREVRTLPPRAGRFDLPPVNEGQGAAVLIQDAAGRVIGAADTGMPVA